MSASSKGASRERQLRKMLEADGWIVVRAAGSKSCVDLWAMYRRSALGKGRVGTEVMALQIKANAGSPWMNFRYEEREALGLLAAKAGATAYLVHWPPHSQPQWYTESEFPEARAAA
jgi:Holliday junction resolvase